MLLGGGELAPSIESQFNTEIEYAVACEQLEACLKIGDQLTQVIDNVYELQAIANKYQSAEALNVIHAVTDGKLVGYSTEGFFADAWDKIKKFFKWLWEKISGFFKWIWEKIKALFGAKRKIKATPTLRKIAEKNPKVEAVIDTIQTVSTKTAEKDAAYGDAIRQVSQQFNSGEAYYNGPTQIDPAAGSITTPKYTVSDVITLCVAMSGNRMKHKVVVRGVHPDRLKNLWHRYAPKIESKGSEADRLVKMLFESDIKSDDDVPVAALNQRMEDENRFLDDMRYDVKRTISDMSKEAIDISDYASVADFARRYQNGLNCIENAERNCKTVWKTMNDKIAKFNTQLSFGDPALKQRDREVLRLAAWIKNVASTSALLSSAITKCYVQSLNSLCNSMEDIIAANEYAQ